MSQGVQRRSLNFGSGGLTTPIQNSKYFIGRVRRCQTLEKYTSITFKRSLNTQSD